MCDVAVALDQQAYAGKSWGDVCSCRQERQTLWKVFGKIDATNDTECNVRQITYVIGVIRRVHLALINSAISLHVIYQPSLTSFSTPRGSISLMLQR